MDMKELNKELTNVKAKFTEEAQAELKRSIEGAENRIAYLMDEIQRRYDLIAELKGTAVYDFFRERAVLLCGRKITIDRIQLRSSSPRIEVSIDGNDLRAEYGMPSLDELCQGIPPTELKEGEYILIVAVLKQKDKS